LGYFKGINRSGFFDRPDGQVEFYPWGVFARGYLLNADQAGRVRQSVRRWNGLGLPIVMGVSIAISTTRLYWLYLPLIVLTIALLPLWNRMLRDVLAGAERTPRRMRLADNAQNMAEGQGILVTLALAVLGLLMTSGSVWVVLTAPSPGRWAGAFGAVFFGFALCLLCYQLFHLFDRI